MALFIARIFKSWGARDAERRWVNNYEIQGGELTLGALDTVVEAIADAERQIHYDKVHFLSATISTWSPDSHPYNPLAFRTIELSGTGVPFAAGVQLLDSNVCLMVQFQADTGRSGRRFYRGCLAEEDVEVGSDGKFTVSAASPVHTRFNQENGYADRLAPYLNGGADPSTIVLAGANVVGVERAVEVVKIGGVVINERNHRYFDRAAV